MDNTTYCLKYKFYARIVSLPQFTLMVLGAFIAFVIAIFISVWANGSYLIVIGLFVILTIYMLSFNFIISKSIKVLAYDDYIEIYYGKNIKHSAPISQLIEIRGADINKKFARQELHFVFEDKTFKFTLWEFNLMHNCNKQIKILRELSAKYQLQKEEYKIMFLDFQPSYRYVNPRYTGKADS